MTLEEIDEIIVTQSGLNQIWDNLMLLSDNIYQVEAPITLAKINRAIQIMIAVKHLEENECPFGSPNGA